MITKNLTCYECIHCGAKFDNAEECERHEARHTEEFKAEKVRFDAFVDELKAIEVVKNIRPDVLVTKTVTETVQVDSGKVDDDGNPIMEDKEVEKEIEVTEKGDLPLVYCSKCMRPVREDEDYVKAFGYTVCPDCMVPVLRSFAKNYANFKSQFLTFMNTVNIHNSEFDPRHPHHHGCPEKRMIINSKDIDSEASDNSTTSSCKCQHVH